VSPVPSYVGSMGIECGRITFCISRCRCNMKYGYVTYPNKGCQVGRVGGITGIISICPRFLQKHGSMEALEKGLKALEKGLIMTPAKGLP
jgi:hypothetical protein